MTELLYWLPFGFVGIVLIVLLAIVRWPDEVDPPTDGMEQTLNAGALRLAAVDRTADVVVIDALIDGRSMLGPPGAPVTLVLATAGTDDASYRRLEGWATNDAVVDVQIPVPGPLHPCPVVDLRDGTTEMRLPILGVSA